MSRTLSKLALIPVALLVCAPVAAQAQPASPDTPAAARAEVAKPLLQQDRDYYFNNVAPAVEDGAAKDQHVGTAGQAARKANPGQAKATTTGFPPAAKQLARREALATTKGISPRRTAEKAGEADCPAGQAADPAGRIQPERQRRLLRLRAAR